MARTIAQQIAVLEARRTILETALDSVVTGTQSFSADGISRTASDPGVIQRELTRVEKSLQRLYRGGRGFQIDLSQTGTDESDVINTTYTAQEV